MAKYSWITLTEVADPGTTGNLEVTIVETGAELHMKVKSDQGFIDSDDKWKAFYEKLDAAVAAAPSLDFENKVQNHSADEYLQLLAKRRQAGDTSSCFSWPTKPSSRTYDDPNAPDDKPKLAAPSPSPAPAPQAKKAKKAGG